MNNKYIDMQIMNLKQAMQITRTYMKQANNGYQYNCLKMQYDYLKSQLRYMESIRPPEQPNQQITPNMSFTLEEIEKNYNGEDGKPSYVVVDDIVFDVSDIGSWAGGSHYGLLAGYDLTQEFNTCHNNMIQLLKNVSPIVGYVVQEQ